LFLYAEEKIEKRGAGVQWAAEHFEEVTDERNISTPREEKERERERERKEERKKERKKERKRGRKY
jgi:hypothetical protein